jgi:hypothetical protein
MAGGLLMKPEFPLRVKFDDGDEWLLESEEQVETNLEWFDTDDGDKTVLVLDRLGRPVRLKVEAFSLLMLELSETATRSTT